MSDSDDDNLPSALECDKRCTAFAEVTGTDSALAMFYLQDREWDLQKSINDFFADSVDTKAAAVVDPEDPEPHRIRLMSWNIDGLDTNNLKTRTTEVANIIKKVNPHVVFLQEVVATSLDLLQNLCPSYVILNAGTIGYFTCIMLHSDHVQLKDQNVTQFFSSKMGRNIFSVQAEVKGVDLWLLTSHFESTKSGSAERIRQLQKAFAEMQKAPTVIFGGDLNLRDHELEKVGGLPKGVLDLWEVTGQRPEARYTWDMSRNDNLNFPNRNAKCRFDRLYMKQQVEGSRAQLKAVYFELVGLERVKACRRFPSDHWGILAHFDKA